MVPLIWPAKNRPFDRAGFQRRAQIARIEKVVFDGVTGARDLRLLETAHAAHHLLLHVEGQAGGNAVGVNLAERQTFRFDENLVRRFVGKAHHLVFDRRAIARTDALDFAAKQRRAMQRLANDVVRFSLVCVMWQLICSDACRRVAHGREYRQRIVARLFLEAR